jgi:hypothetical protein
MDAAREYWAAVAAGDPETIADAMDRFGPRRYDMVGCWPSDRLDELAAKRPDLLPELIRRRPSEVQQL